MTDDGLRIEPYAYRPRSGGEVAAERGSLAVPETRSGASPRRLTLSFVRLPRRGGASDTPVLFLAGGPGESAIDSGRGRMFRLFDALRDVGDVILLDQRGAGHSSRLECAAWEWPNDRPVKRDGMLELATERSAHCRERLAAAGVDLAAYNTVESADDLYDLARALGVERLHLVGHSYGTHLAMALVRRHPDLVGRAVLAGPEGPDHTYKLPSAIQAQLVRIEEHSGVNGFVERVSSVLAALDATPATVELPDPGSGERATLEVGRFDVEWITAAGLADTRLIPLLPAWYGQMERGDTTAFGTHELLAKYLFHLRRGLGRSAMSLCMDIASGATQARLDRIHREAAECVLGRTVDFPFPEIAAAWNIPDLGDDFRAPPRTNAPTMFITGEWDCRTPPTNVEELAPGFSNSRHVHVEGAGHTDALDRDGVIDRVVDFLRGKDPKSGVVPSPPLVFREA